MTPEYESYLKSDEWRDKKNRRMKIDGYKCRACGSTHNLQVHHLNYYSVGHEDVWKDIATICDDCHVLIHNFMSRPTGINTDGSIKYGWQTTLPWTIKRNLKERGLM